MEDTAVIDEPEKSATTGEDLSQETTAIPFTNPDSAKISFIKRDDEEDYFSNIDDYSPKPKDEKEEKSEKDDVTEDKQPSDERESYTYDEFVDTINRVIEKQSDGKITNIDQISSLIDEINRLKEEVNTKREPEFVNEKAKLIFDYANKAAGFELEAARQLLHVVSLGDVDKLSDKDAQFEAFMLTRNDLSREMGRKIFEAEYEEKYSDLENNLLQADRHSIATRDAKNKLKELQKQFSEARGDAPAKDDQVSESIHNSIKSVLPDFGGLSIPLGDGDNEVLNLPLDEAEEAEFNEFLIEPVKFIDSIIEASMDEKNNFNPRLWVSEMFTLYKAFKGDLAKEIYNLGKTNGQLQIVNDRKNIASTKEKGAEATPKKKTFEETVLEAVLGKSS